MHWFLFLIQYIQYLLLLVLCCCSIPFCPFFVFCFFLTLHFPFFCFPPSLPPLTHPPLRSFLPFNYTFPSCFSSSFPFPIFSSFNFSPSTITHFLNHSFLSHLDSTVTTNFWPLIKIPQTNLPVPPLSSLRFMFSQNVFCFV